IWKSILLVFSLLLGAERFIHNLYPNGVQVIASAELSFTNEKHEMLFSIGKES
ncbi:hypothetical protein D920_00908, partial [Enterococcus faecalis 13-SD-W-01]